MKAFRVQESGAIAMEPSLLLMCTISRTYFLVLRNGACYCWLVLAYIGASNSRLVMLGSAFRWVVKRKYSISKQKRVGAKFHLWG